MDLAAIQKRIDDLIAKGRTAGSSLESTSELYSGALTVISAVHGPQSHQVISLKRTGDDVYADIPKLSLRLERFHPVVLGVLESLKGELNAGLAGSLQGRIAGEVLTDLIQLARVVLGESGDDAKNVAAVLAAAAFEDTIRRMGVTFGGVTGRPDLNDVLQALKANNTLQGPQFSTAQSYLTFRNKALHADWQALDRPTVTSVLGFLQELLLKHFQ